MSKISSKASLAVLVSALLMVSGLGLAQSWDGSTATNNDDGGNDQTSDTDSTSDSDEDSGNTDSVTADGWDGSSATNDDDGSGTNQTWDGDSAENDDDGNTTSTAWDGKSATNDDDSDSTSTSWNTGNSTNNDDSDGTGTQWDGGSATNDDNGDNDESSDSESDSNSNKDDSANNQDNNDGSSSGGGDGVSSVSWTTVKVLEPDIQFQLSPSPVKAGEPVKVTGKLQHGKTKAVNVLMDGEQVAQTQSNDQGSFNTRFTPEKLGTHTVTVESSGTSAEAQIEVKPSVQVSGITSNVFQDSSSTAVICADVESQVTPTVKLVKDGQTLMTKSSIGNVCFERNVERGVHEFTVVGEVDGDTSQASTTVTVNEVRRTGLDTGIQGTQDLSNEQRGLLAGLLNSIANLFASIAGLLAQAI